VQVGKRGSNPAAFDGAGAGAGVPQPPRRPAREPGSSARGQRLGRAGGQDLGLAVFSAGVTHRVFHKDSAPGHELRFVVRFKRFRDDSVIGWEGMGDSKLARACFAIRSPISRSPARDIPGLIQRKAVSRPPSIPPQSRAAARWPSRPGR